MKTCQLFRQLRALLRGTARVQKHVQKQPAEVRLQNTTSDMDSCGILLGPQVAQGDTNGAVLTVEAAGSCPPAGWTSMLAARCTATMVESTVLRLLQRQLAG